MTSPGSRSDQLDRLQIRLNRWATANLDVRRKIPIDRPQVRGRSKLIRKFGKVAIQEVERKAQVHRAKVFVNLRRMAGIKVRPEDIPKQFRKDVKVRKEKVLFTRTKLGVSKVQDSLGRIHYRNDKNGRFTTKPRRHRVK